MYDRDTRVAKEVPNVQCEQVSDAVDLHRGDQPGIVYLRSRDRVREYETAPFRMDSLIIWQELERSLDPLRWLVSFHRRQAVSISACRARAGVPELHHVLRDITEPVAARLECVNTATDQRKLWIIR